MSVRQMQIFKTKRKTKSLPEAFERGLMLLRCQVRWQLITSTASGSLTTWLLRWHSAHNLAVGRCTGWANESPDRQLKSNTHTWWPVMRTHCCVKFSNPFHQITSSCDAGGWVELGGGRGGGGVDAGTSASIMLEITWLIHCSHI